MAIGCASNNTAAGNTAAGRESPRVLWLTRPGCRSIVSLPSLSKSRIWIENGQKGPHTADKSCYCLIESHSQSTINRLWGNDQRIDPRRSRPLPPRVGWYGRACDRDPQNYLNCQNRQTYQDGQTYQNRQRYQNHQDHQSYQEDPAPRGYNEPAGERLAQTAPRMRQPGGPSATTLRSLWLKLSLAVLLSPSREGIVRSMCVGWNFRQRLAFARIVVFVC